MAQGKVKRSWRAKRLGYGLNMRVFPTTDDREDQVLLIQDPAGRFHTFVEVEAKQAARRCGAPKGLTTDESWSFVIKNQEKGGASEP
jgi:hypothetical protein